MAAASKKSGNPEEDPKFMRVIRHFLQTPKEDSGDKVSQESNDSAKKPRNKPRKKSG